jgi:hypothetical protein
VRAVLTGLCLQGCADGCFDRAVLTDSNAKIQQHCGFIQHSVRI